LQGAFFMMPKERERERERSPVPFARDSAIDFRMAIESFRFDCLSATGERRLSGIVN